jgi:cytochrome oxidase Cu insertion factor (SCO1/SenC/PrrC family)
MAWGYIRVAIFSTAFLVGLLLAGSGGRSVEAKTGTPQNLRKAVEIQCPKNNFTLIRRDSERVVPGDHITGM